jgi:hypothetical protein
VWHMRVPQPAGRAAARGAGQSFCRIPAQPVDQRPPVSGTVTDREQREHEQRPVNFVKAPSADACAAVKKTTASWWPLWLTARAIVTSRAAPTRAEDRRPISAPAVAPAAHPGLPLRVARLGML